MAIQLLDLRPEGTLKELLLKWRRAEALGDDGGRPVVIIVSVVTVFPAD